MHIRCKAVFAAEEKLISSLMTKHKQHNTTLTADLRTYWIFLFLRMNFTLQLLCSPCLGEPHLSPRGPSEDVRREGRLVLQKKQFDPMKIYRSERRWRVNKTKQQKKKCICGLDSEATSSSFNVCSPARRVSYCR